MVRSWEYTKRRASYPQSKIENLTLYGFLLSVVTPWSTIANLNPWGARDEELAVYTAIQSGMLVTGAALFGFESSRLVYYMGMLATTSNASLAMGGLGILAIAGAKAQHHSMSVDKAGSRTSGTFGVAPSLHLINGRPYWEASASELFPNM